MSLLIFFLFFFLFLLLGRPSTKNPKGFRRFKSNLDEIWQKFSSSEWRHTFKMAAGHDVILRRKVLPPGEYSWILIKRVDFRIGSVEGKVWASPFSRTPLSFGPCETTFIRLRFRRWLCASSTSSFVFLWCMSNAGVKQLARKPSLTWNSHSRSFTLQ